MSKYDNCYIHMKDVNMCYPSNVYNATTLKQEIFSRLKLEKPKRLLKDIRALQGFSMDVSVGDRVGVIGRNGAGKSTLLKTIAGIYPIDSGTLEVRGKIRSLFEISLGFDLESTGIENIVYRGLLLGATPAEIQGKMDEIVAFADLGEFINYPIKSYSSGMLVRLAFAVSTSINGEILLLDEVVGAGDAKFMEKAQKRIYELMDDAKMMVFVSHDLNLIKNVCNRAIWLDGGIKGAEGSPDEVVRMYLDSTHV